LTWVAGYILR